jgi:hypothetical protein
MFKKSIGDVSLITLKKKKAMAALLPLPSSLGFFGR